MLTHANFVSNVLAINAQGCPISSTDTALSVLPLSHIFERTGFYIFLLQRRLRLLHGFDLIKLRRTFVKLDLL